MKYPRSRLIVRIPVTLPLAGAEAFFASLEQTCPAGTSLTGRWKHDETLISSLTPGRPATG